jgi:hypothetical protein
MLPDPVSAVIAETAVSPCVALRPTTVTVAPRRTSSRAVTKPIPAVPPVTRQNLPDIADMQAGEDLVSGARHRVTKLCPQSNLDRMVIGCNPPAA